jgi:hypothetical protein
MRERAAQCIDRVSRVDDDATIAQAFDHLRDEAVIDIVGIDTE